MIVHPRRSLIPTESSDQSSPAIPQGVVTPADIARCTDFQITHISEDIAGMCVAAGTSCVSTSQFTVHYANAVDPVTYKWDVQGVGATIPSDGQGGFYDTEKTVIVNVSSQVDEHFDLEVTATDADGHIHTMKQTFTVRRA
jgi:hypothetical protein